METGDNEGMVRMEPGPVIGGTEEVGDKKQEILRALIPDVPIKQRAVDHVLEKKIFILPGKGFSGKNAAI